jgi:hypothetical protein
VFGGARWKIEDNFDYHLLPPDTQVTTWTGKEDTTAAAALFAGKGGDPHDESQSEIVSNSMPDLAPGATTTLLDVDGPREITAIKLSIVGVSPVHSASPTYDAPLPYQDDGRAFTGSSTFTVAVDPNNDGVVLQRRLDHSIADQTANITVDGQSAGTWADKGADTTYQWRNDSFPLPRALTTGKTKITVKVAFASSQIDWNEFFYRVYSRVVGAEVLTDTLDVGNAASETAHGYTIVTPTFAGSQNFTYPPSSAFAGRLNNLWTRATCPASGPNSPPLAGLFPQPPKP